MVVQHVHFWWFAVKQLAKDVFKAKINGVKVWTGSLLGCISLHHAIAIDSSYAWYMFCNIGFYTCVYCAVAETCGLAIRLATLYRLYLCCDIARSE